MVATGVASWLSMLVLVGSGFLGLPVSMPPLPEDPVMAKIAPAECLAYFTWAGLAKPDPDSKNHTEQLLAEEQVQRLYKTIDAQIVAAVARSAPRDEASQTIAAEAPALIKALLSHPLAMFVSNVSLGAGGVEVEAGIVLGTGEDTAAIKASLEKLYTIVDPTFGRGGAFEGKWNVVQLPPGMPTVEWGFRGKYLVIGIGRGTAEEILGRAKSPAPRWLADLRKTLPVERMSTIQYVNIRGIVDMAAPFGGPQVRNIIDTVGLGSIKSYSAISGLDGPLTVNRSLLATDENATGLWGAVEGKPLTAVDLNVIPADSTLAAAVRLDAHRVYHQVLRVIGEIEPRAVEQAVRAQKQAEAELGIRFSEDLLQGLGDTWCAYTSPSDGALVYSGATLVVTVRDREKLDRTLTKLMAFWQTEIDRQREFRPRGAMQMQSFDFAGQKVHFITFAGGEAPVAPAWCLTDKHLVIALYPQTIKSFLSRAASGDSLAKVPLVAKALNSTDGGPHALVYHDDKALFGLVYPMLQAGAPVVCAELQRHGFQVDASMLPSADVIAKHLQPGLSTVSRTKSGVYSETRASLSINAVAAPAFATALLLPAVQAARDAARRNQSMNNLRQFTLAMLTFEAEKGKLPAASISKDGKPLLSWRVQLLPYLDQRALYDEFKLDEPWDSEHNRKLIERMPEVFRNPRLPLAPGRTSYVVPRGPKTLFEDAVKSTAMKDVTDGLSNTILVIEASPEAAVVWTQPEDLAIDLDSPRVPAGLGGDSRGMISVALADGSVQNIRAFEVIRLKAMLTRNGGEAIPPAFEGHGAHDAPQPAPSPRPAPRTVPAPPPPGR